MRLPWQRDKEPEKRELTESQWVRLFETKGTSAGADVTVDNAIYSLAVAACILVRSKAMGSLPVHLYAQDGDVKRKATELSDYGVYKTAWNPTTPAAIGWRWLQQQLDANGNAYVRVERRANRITALYQITGETEPVTNTTNGIPVVIGYKTRDAETTDWVPLRLADVIHFRSDVISADGVTGVSLIDIAREAIGLDVTATNFLGSWFKNGTHFGNLLGTDQTLTTSDIEAILDQLKDGKGVAPANKARLFTKGVKPLKNETSFKDAEMTETRRYNLERICGVFSVPLVKVQAMWFGTYSNTEQGSLDWAKDGVAPMAVNIEQTIAAKLYADGKHYIKFEMNAIMRGDWATRMAGLASAVNGGIFTPNEARAWEELDPLPGGDELRFPLNSMPASQIDDDTDGVSTDTDSESNDSEDESDNVVTLTAQAASKREAGKTRVQLQRSMRGMFEDAARRIVRREVNDIRREAQKNMRSVGDFRTFLAKFYRDFPAFYKQQLEPVVRSYGSAIAELAAAEAGGTYSADALDDFVKGYVGTSSKRYMASHQGQLEKLLSDEVASLDAIEGRLDGWEETTPSKVASRESVEAGGAFSKFAFVAAGVTSLMWVNTSERSCPYCESLDGHIVGIERPFADGGSDVAGLPVSNDSFHPPLHEGCECIVVPS